jgi:hypothetical protein
MVFAPDGKSLYFIAPDPAQVWVNHLYQWPLAGGKAKKIADHVDGPISFSPDGVEFTFVRHLGHQQGALTVRNVATGTERSLMPVVSTAAFMYSPAWSADGREIACASMGQLLLISAQTGEIKKKTNAPGYAMGVAWPAQGGLVGLAGVGGGQIWRYDPARDRWEAITEKSEVYAGVRIAATRDGSILAAVRQEDMMPVTNCLAQLFGMRRVPAYYSNVVLIHLPH